MKNERAALSPAQESRLRAPTQRNRRASPHAKAFCGCTTPLSPPLRTAVRQRPGHRTPSAADDALRVHKARSAHQSRSGSRSGQDGWLLLQERPSGGCAARLRSPPTTVPLRPDGRHRPLTPRASEVAHGLYQQSPAYQSRPTPRSDRSSAVPLRCGGERRATDYYDMCDGMLYPRMTACEAAPKGLSRASPGCCNGPGGSVQSQPWHRAIPPGPAG